MTDEQKPHFFGPFKDVVDSRFYSSTTQRLTPEQTFAQVEASLARTIAGMRQGGPRRRLTMSDETLTRMHRSIFGGLFREVDGAGRYRQAHEPAWFGVPLRREGRWSSTRVKGADPSTIRAELMEVFAEWNEWPGDEGGRVQLPKLALALAKLYTGVLRVHPFVDGNHRTSYAMLARALWWLDLPLIRFRSADSKREHDRAAAPALLTGRDAQPFADLLRIRLEQAKGATL
jgi:fido (protein-threonine AMPylation protein)